MGPPTAICGGDRSWDGLGAFPSGKSADFPSIHGHRRGFGSQGIVSAGFVI